MSTIHAVPPNYPKEIIGYPQPWIVSPGDIVDIKVSCTEERYQHRTVRIIQGSQCENGPSPKAEQVTAIAAGSCPGRFQLANPGSYGKVVDLGLRSDDSGIAVSFYFQSWLKTCDHNQVLVSTIDVQSKTGVAAMLNEAMQIELWIGTGHDIRNLSTGYVVEKMNWVKADLDIREKTVKLRLVPLIQGLSPAGKSWTFEQDLGDTIRFHDSSQLLLAASTFKNTQEATVHTAPKNHFNGRLDTVHIEALGHNERVIAHYDFAIDIPTDFFRDTSGNGRHGVLVNAPSRAVKGHDWDGSETDWTKARYGYGAIHFHEDDLDDAEWNTDFSITVPVDARSGVYGVELECITSQVKDTVVFFVRPSALASKSSPRAALVMSTFTYLAYANEHQFDPDTPARAEVPGGLDSLEFYKDENFHKQDRRRDLGLSCYDVHRDWSAVMFTSAKRPLLNCRPDYVNWTGHRPRELSAELIMQGFMDRLEIEYDIVTDHDLHLQGSQALKNYSVVITGCHPEYPSLQSYQAYEDYIRAGGNLMYLGGNGFYWSTATDPLRPHRLEVRRGGQGVRTSYQEPGERHHALDGNVGGLWRDRGKAANFLVGVGCCGEGAGPGVPYMTNTSVFTDNKDLAWVFEGLPIPPSGELIFGRNALGGFGGGASADEIDRVDFKYGSPTNIVVLASSTGHPDTFGLFPEDVGFPMTKTLGSQNNLIRSDMAYYETCGGGAVFSVGSISWYCALGWNSYDNDVAVITKNVLLRFLSLAK